MATATATTAAATSPSNFPIYVVWHGMIMPLIPASNQWLGNIDLPINEHSSESFSTAKCSYLGIDRWPQDAFKSAGSGLRNLTHRRGYSAALWAFWRRWSYRSIRTARARPRSADISADVAFPKSGESVSRQVQPIRPGAALPAVAPEVAPPYPKICRAFGFDTLLANLLVFLKLVSLIGFKTACFLVPSVIS